MNPPAHIDPAASCRRIDGLLAESRAALAAFLNVEADDVVYFPNPTTAVNMVARTTLEPWDLGDVAVPAGEVLYCLIGAANHDPAVFDGPERFDVGRSPNPQLSFGGGVHYCVGAPLARLEAEVAFAALLARFPGLALESREPAWRPMINLRGLASLRVRGA